MLTNPEKKVGGVQVPGHCGGQHIVAHPSTFTQRHSNGSFCAENRGVSTQAQTLCISPPPWCTSVSVGFLMNFH